jgi:hypothetical protein
MTIRLEALSAVDGIGIFRKDDTLRLLRPPYLFSDSPILSEESLSEAIVRSAFSPAAEDFHDWPEAIAFLNRVTAETRHALGREVPDSIDGAEMIESAPEAVLRDLIERVEKSLIPQRLFDNAENFLLVFLSSDALVNYPALAKRAASLLQLSKSERLKMESRNAEICRRDLRFPSLERHGGLQECDRVAETIKRRHCVFA